MLTRAGFQEVYSLEGGIRAWNGLKAEGFPETGWFFTAETPAQSLAMAWLLEEGTRRFYLEIATRMNDPQMHEIFSRLTQSEVNHQQMLVDMWPELTNSIAPDPPSNALEKPPPEAILEHGLSLQDGLRWCEGKSAREILEFSISMETAAYDRYLRLFNETSETASRSMFSAWPKRRRNTCAG